MHEIEQRRGVGRLRAEAAHEPTGLAAEHEVLGVGVGQRGDADLGVADDLGEHAAGPERDERPEHRVLDDAGEQLGAAADHRLDQRRQADPRQRLAPARARRAGRARPRRARSCAPRAPSSWPRPGSRARSPRPDPPPRWRRTAPPRAGGRRPRAASAPRAAPASVVGALEGGGHDVASPRRVDAVELRHRAGRPPQPVGARRRVPERRGRRLGVAEAGDRAAPSRSAAGTPPRSSRPRAPACRGGRPRRRPVGSRPPPRPRRPPPAGRTARSRQSTLAVGQHRRQRGLVRGRGRRAEQVDGVAEARPRPAAAPRAPRACPR